MSKSPTTELDVAKAVADGRLPSPTEFGNSKYFRLRISGTRAVCIGASSTSSVTATPLCGYRQP